MIGRRARTEWLAVGLAIAAVLLLVWVIGAVGVLGASGDPADLMYIGVISIGVIGAAAVRLEPHGMSRVMAAMAIAQGVVAVVALLLGKHQAPHSSVGEILGLNGLFCALYLGSAWLFRKAAS